MSGGDPLMAAPLRCLRMAPVSITRCPHCLQFTFSLFAIGRDWSALHEVGCRHGLVTKAWKAASSSCGHYIRIFHSECTLLFPPVYACQLEVFQLRC